MDIVNSVAMNIWVHVSFSRKVLSGHMPESGIAGSYYSSMYSLLLGESGQRFVNFVYLFQEPALGLIDFVHCFLNLYFIDFPFEMIYIHNGKPLSCKKDQNNAICSNMDGTRDSHPELSKSE